MTQHAIEQAYKKYSLVLNMDDINNILCSILAGKEQKLKMINKKGQIKECGQNYQYAYRIKYSNQICDVLIQNKPDREPVVITFYEKPTNNKFIIKNYKDKSC